MSDFIIKELFRKSFGYEPPGEFKLEQAVARKESSDLGQPFYDVDDMGREHFMPVRIEGWLIPFAVVSITPKKIIVSTPMVERKGSVHEIISIDDYSINIKGILLSKTNDYPEADVTKLHEIFLLNRSVELRSAKTDIFLKGDDKVVIREMPMPPVAGVQHAQAFEINCTSDTIFTLEQ
jgi:Domain of unknown function (DUF6046)